jgi:hypothetical protein
MFLFLSGLLVVSCCTATFLRVYFPIRKRAKLVVRTGIYFPVPFHDHLLDNCHLSRWESTLLQELLVQYRRPLVARVE